MTVDKFDQLTTSISQILDALEESYPVETRSSDLNAFLDSCRQFCSGRSIPDYPDWLEQLRHHSNALTPAVQHSRLRETARSTTALIEDVSFGASEDEHIAESERILQAFRDSGA